MDEIQALGRALGGNGLAGAARYFSSMWACLTRCNPCLPHPSLAVAATFSAAHQHCAGSVQRCIRYLDFGLTAA